MNGLKFYFLFIRVTRLPSYGLANIYVYNKRGLNVQAKEKSMIYRRGTEFAEFGVFLIKNSLLCAFRASAVSSLLDRDNQNRHWEICASRENFLCERCASMMNYSYGTSRLRLSRTGMNDVSIVCP